MRKLLLVVLTVCGLTTTLFALAQGPGWVTLFDGSNLDSFNRVGNANWTLAHGIVEAMSGQVVMAVRASVPHAPPTTADLTTAPR